jgi:hypothetical protein
LLSKKRKSPPSSSSSTSPSSTSSSFLSATRTSNSSRRRHHQHQEKKLKKKHHHAASSSLSLLSAAAASTESSPLSGFIFVKEARYAKQQQPLQPQHQQEDSVEEIKSLEQFRFEGSAFFFSYQFWRGRTLLHSFEIEAGTFFLVDDQDNTLNTADNINTNTTTTPSHHQQQRKVVLRWPSPVYYPLLQTWRFHQTYSHFLLHEPTTIPVSVPAASSAPSSLPPPTCAAGGLCLVSRLGSVFVQGE